MLRHVGRSKRVGPSYGRGSCDSLTSAQLHNVSGPRILPEVLDQARGPPQQRHGLLLGPGGPADRHGRLPPPVRPPGSRAEPRQRSRAPARPCNRTLDSCCPRCGCRCCRYRGTPRSRGFCCCCASHFATRTTSVVICGLCMLPHGCASVNHRCIA